MFFFNLFPHKTHEAKQKALYISAEPDIDNLTCPELINCLSILVCSVLCEVMVRIVYLLSDPTFEMLDA